MRHTEAVSATTTYGHFSHVTGRQRKDAIWQFVRPPPSHLGSTIGYDNDIYYSHRIRVPVIYCSYRYCTELIRYTPVLLWVGWRLALVPIQISSSYIPYDRYARRWIRSACSAHSRAYVLKILNSFSQKQTGDNEVSVIMPRYSILLAVQLLIFLQLQSRMTGIYGFSVIRSLPSTVTPRFTCIVATNRLDRLNRLNGPLFLLLV